METGGRRGDFYGGKSVLSNKIVQRVSDEADFFDGD